MTERAWVEDEELTDLKALVARLTPGYESLAITRRDRFGDTLVLTLGEERVLRVARSQTRARHIANERLLLESLQGRLGVCVPAPDLFGTSPAFLSHPWLAGTPWLWDKIEMADEAARARFAEDYADLMVSLHALRLDAIAASQRNWASNMLNFMMRQAARIKMLDPSGRAYELLVDAVADYHAWRQSGEAVLLHNDLHTGNLLWNSDRSALTGVIDWSDSCIGDPHWEFRKLRLVDDALRENIIRQYENKTGRRIDRERVVKLERFQLVLVLADQATTREKFERSFMQLIAHADGDRRFV